MTHCVLSQNGSTNVKNITDAAGENQLVNFRREFSRYWLVKFTSDSILQDWLSMRVLVIAGALRAQQSN